MLDLTLVKEVAQKFHLLGLLSRHITRQHPQSDSINSYRGATGPSYLTICPS